jgi:hypothetical protein
LFRGLPLSVLSGSTTTASSDSIDIYPAGSGGGVRCERQLRDAKLTRRGGAKAALPALVTPPGQMKALESKLPGHINRLLNKLANSDQAIPMPVRDGSANWQHKLKNDESSAPVGSGFNLPSIVEKARLPRDIRPLPQPVRTARQPKNITQLPAIPQLQRPDNQTGGNSKSHTSRTMQRAFGK